MNLYFNDLTVPDSADAIKRHLREFAVLFAEFNKLTGEQRTWVPLFVKEKLQSLPWGAQDVTLWSWANAAMGIKGGGAPVEPDAVEDRFLTSKFYIRIGEQKADCGQMGLAALSKPSAARSSLTMGFPKDEFWGRLNYKVLEEVSDSKSVEHSSVCVVDINQLSAKDVREWCQLSYEVKLPMSQLLPEDKPKHIRDDHGSDVLVAFAKRIVRSPYVEQVINSLPFNPSGSEFIEKVYENGVVYIRLIHDPRGVGLAVQTTARNLDHAERIARILDKEYR